MHDEQGAHNEGNTHRWLLLTINIVCMMTTMPTNNMVATVTMVSFMNVPPYNDHGGKRCLQCPRRWECPQWPWYGAHHAHDWGTHKKQWHVWHVTHSQLCLKNKSTRFPIRKQYNIYRLSTSEVWEQIKCTTPFGMKRTEVMDHVI